MGVVGGSLSPLEYHQATKHAFGRFARAVGYLDWANQPDPFRRFAGAPILELPRVPVLSNVPYGELYTGGIPPQPVSLASIGEFLRCSLGLSAWKAYGSSRWALRVNPSSGNLHPTEGYLLWNDRVCHYTPADHALEERAVLAGHPWPPARDAGHADAFLVGLTSIHWREAWKYGERAFRYCQHDVGHALGALRLAAAMLGWHMTLLPSWSHAEMSTLLGIDRDQDFGDAEREEPDAIAIVSAAPVEERARPTPASLTAAARSAEWFGRANRLSPSRLDWPAIDDVAAATAYPGIEGTEGPSIGGSGGRAGAHQPSARQIILQRRSATAFDPRGTLRRDTFLSMLARLVPQGAPWDLQSWSPQVHLLLFVHRVQDMVPGVYAFLRTDDAALDEWRKAMHPDFLWERVPGTGGGGRSGLFLLAPLDVRDTARRLSCDQDIAADGFFSLGMLAHLASVSEQGPWFYRQLFWECGLIGQVLYLEAEAAGARSTGIGCFYDDPVHAVVGLKGDAWQSLYHFSMGLPLDDGRLTTEPGYPWEAKPGA